MSRRRLLIAEEMTSIVQEEQRYFVCSNYKVKQEGQIIRMSFSSDVIYTKDDGDEFIKFQPRETFYLCRNNRKILLEMTMSLVMYTTFFGKANFIEQIQKGSYNKLLQQNSFFFNYPNRGIYKLTFSIGKLHRTKKLVDNAKFMKKVMKREYEQNTLEPLGVKLRTRPNNNQSEESVDSSGVSEHKNSPESDLPVVIETENQSVRSNSPKEDSIKLFRTSPTLNSLAT